MLPSARISDLAHRFIFTVSSADAPAGQTGLTSLRAYEKLRQQLSAPVGIDAFRVLASRALVLAQGQTGRLSHVQVTANGALRGLGEMETAKGMGEDNESGILLIEQLLGLFLTFLGETTTLRLIEDIRLPVEARMEWHSAPVSDSVSLTQSGTPSVSPFEDILFEADQLRQVSERIEILADKHVAMEEGLMSVAGNIRNVAAVLDIYTLLRSKAGGSQDGAANPPTHGYVN